VQAYVGFAAAAGEPPRQLKAFARVFLRPGRAGTVRLRLSRASFEFFDQSRGRWTVAPGRYHVYVGTSSRSLPLTGHITLR
jgi:beta-glucosidase